jgi:hypothetical protein
MDQVQVIKNLYLQYLEEIDQLSCKGTSFRELMGLGGRKDDPCHAKFLEEVTAATQACRDLPPAECS